MKMSEIVCPVCGNPSYQYLNSFNLTLEDTTLAIGHVRLVRCRKCGLAYVNPQPRWDVTDTRNLYGRAYFQADYMKFYGGDRSASKTNESFQKGFR